jgi:tetratricopeptide (TPR) repeat protein
MPTQPESCSKSGIRCLPSLAVSPSQRNGPRVPGIIFWCLAIGACFYGAWLPAAGQTGTLQGSVRTAAGKGIPAAKLILRSGPARRVFSTRTDSSGNYRLKAAAATYRVEVAREGYSRATQSGLVVKDGSVLRLDFVLKPSSRPSEASLSAIHFYEPSGLRAGQLTNPAAGGGYSNSATMRSAEMIKAYLSPPGSPKTPALVLPADGQQGNAVPLARLRQLAQEEPTEPNLERWGSALLVCHKYSLATQAFQQSLARFRTSARLWTGFGISLYSEGRYNDAEEALIHAAQLDPATPQVYDFLGQAYHYGSGTDRTVAGLLERFIRLQPRNAHAHYDYALILWRGRLNRQSPALLGDVESELRTAIALAPDFPDARFQLGVLYDTEKMTALAIDQYQVAIRLRPDFAKAHYRLAQDYLRVGKKAQASAELGIYDELAAQGERP